MIKRILTIVVIALLIAGGVIVVKKKRAELAKTPTLKTSPVPVNIVKVKRGDLVSSIHYLGEIKPLNYADVSSRILSRIVSVNVREGDRVKKGEVLVELDSSELRETLRAKEHEVQAVKEEIAGAESRYRTLQSVFSRDEMLYENGAISKEKYELSRAARDEALSRLNALRDRLHSLEKALDVIKVKLGYTRIRAPFDALISGRLLEPGDMAVPGKPILRIYSPHGFRTIVKVPEKEIMNVKKGGRAILRYNGRSMEASVSRIYPAVTAVTLGTIEIDTPRAPFDLPPGSRVAVDVVTETRKSVLLVPVNALLEDRRGAFVFTVSDGKIKTVKVKLLGKNSRYAGIEAPLSPGDPVVVGSEGKLLMLGDGIRVNPVAQGGVL